MDRAEHIVKPVIEACLQGSTLIYRCEQSHGEWDFDLSYSGKTVAVEVTQATTQSQMEIMGATKRRRGVIGAKYCKRTWIVFLGNRPKIPQIRKNIDDYLWELERLGLEQFSCTGSSDDRLEKLCRLGVISGTAIQPENAPQIMLNLSASGFKPDPLAAIEAGEREAQKKDNRKKLGKANTEERHLAVHIDVTNGLSWHALTKCNPPIGKRPILPDEITHIWLIGYSGEANKNEFVVWRGSTREPWQSQRVAIPESECAAS